MLERRIDQIDRYLASLRVSYEKLTLRERVLKLVEVLKSLRLLNKFVARDSGCDAGGARERIKLYLIANVGVQIDAVELEVVSGISEYGRRVRELRNQDGYEILSCFSSDPEIGLDIGGSKYLLLRTEPDVSAAHRWHIANRIRRTEGSARKRILDYLQHNVGQIVTSEEIYYVARIKDAPRRVRELRTEEGYAVATFYNGRPDLKPGEYVLENLDRVAPPHDRHIPDNVQKEVFERDQVTCRNCGWSRQRWTREDPRFLELHHFEHHAKGGKNNTANLGVFCNRCHDLIHANKIDVDPPKA